jgi:hypothetical protein
VRPTNPASTAIINASASAAKIANVRQALSQLTNNRRHQRNVSPCFSHRITNFANITTREMFIHLYTTYSG